MMLIDYRSAKRMSLWGKRIGQAHYLVTQPQWLCRQTQLKIQRSLTIVCAGTIPKNDRSRQQVAIAPLGALPPLQQVI
jgi:hypothetical protein